MHTYKKRYIHIYPYKKAGFTFLEVILTTFLIGLFTLSLVSLETFLADSRETLQVNAQSYNEAAIAIGAMTREIRNARPAATGAYPLVLADDQEIIFYANVDTDPQPERVRYYLQSNQLNRGIIQPVGTPPTYDSATEGVNLVIPYIVNGANPIFYYYNGDWPSDTANNPLPAPTRLTETKLVTVSITINPNPTQVESNYELSSSAMIRNLKSNL